MKLFNNNPLTGFKIYTSARLIVVFMLLHLGLKAQEVRELPFREGKANEHFGWDMAMTNGWLAIAMPHATTNAGEDAGSVIIYRNNERQWEFFQEISDEDGDIFENFGYSIDISDNVLVIGAIGTFQNGPFSGKAFVYEFSDDTWQQTAILTASDGHALANFGHSVTTNGELVAVGAVKANGAQTNSGAVYVFNKDGDAWVEEQKLTAADGASNDDFGFAIDLSADGSLLIGAPAHEGVTDNGGAAYVFERENNVWTNTQKLGSADGDTHLYLGSSVAIEEEDLMVGAYFADGNEANAGAVFHFQKSGNNWEEAQKIIAPDGRRNDHFGVSLDMSSTAMIIGAPKANPASIADAGLAYFYSKTENEWELTQVLEEPNQAVAHNFFGSAVAIHQTDIAIGAVLNDRDEVDGGAVYNSVPGEVDVITSVGIELEKLALLNYPNPTREHTTIRYKLLAQSEVSILIFDNQGRMIRDLLPAEMQQPGLREITWDLQTTSGQSVTPGIYHYQLIMNGQKFSRRIVVN